MYLVLHKLEYLCQYKYNKSCTQNVSTEKMKRKKRKKRKKSGKYLCGRLSDETNEAAWLQGQTPQRFLREALELLLLLLRVRHF
jgi:hypothetical protein